MKMNEMFDPDYYKVGAAQHVMDMYRNTGLDGKLMVPGFRFDPDDTDDEAIICRMNWTEEDAIRIIEPFEKFCRGQRTAVENGNRVSAAAVAFCGAGLFQTECSLICSRLYRLYKLKAPEMVIEGEKQMLARAYALNRFAVEIISMRPEDLYSL